MGRTFEDWTCFKVATSYEQRMNWRMFKYGAEK
jgi:hypothetical protein